MQKIVPSICRNCLAFCPILVTVENGRAVKVSGDPAAELYEGYTCPKGRALPDQHNDPSRLLTCLQRGGDGRTAPVASADAITKIAARVRDLIDQHGPKSIAAYIGTGVVSHPTGATMAAAWFRAIGSPMIFSAATIDKPAANTSTALHGNWVAGAQSFADSDTWMIVGGNPVISKSNGAPYNNPAQRLKDAAKRGMKLIVIDPRRTETAKRAHIHLQLKPGEDPTLLAALVNIIIREKLYDSTFVARHAHGLNALTAAVAPFTPEYAAARAGVPADDLLAAARAFAGGKRGSVVCSTGPSFSTHSNLAYYLALCLNTLCGRWGREGDRAAFPNVMLPAFTPKAEPYPPYPVFGTTVMRVRGLRENASGLPTAALADEILTPGPGQIKALFCLGGNPILAWPDQQRAQQALRALDLLVVFDYRMTATAGLADYIIASPLSLEVPAATYFVESLKYIGVSRGFEVPWAQYTPKIVDPPAGSDLLDDREFFFRLAQTMKLELEWVDHYGYGPHVETPSCRTRLDMSKVPSVDDLIELTCGSGRVPLDTVKQHPHGHLFETVNVPIEPADPGSTAKLELGDDLMMRDLEEVHATNGPPRFDGLDFQLVARRANNFMNSVGQTMQRLNRGIQFGAAYLNPADLARLDLKPGDVVRIRSAHGAIINPVDADDTIRPGVISMTHGFGAQSAGGVEAPDTTGASVTRLINLDECDPITGIPRMSAVPVAIEKVAAAPHADAQPM